MSDDMPSVVRNIFGSGVPSDEDNARKHAADVEVAELRARRAKIVTDFIGFLFAVAGLAIGGLLFVGFAALVRWLFF